MVQEKTKSRLLTHWLENLTGHMAAAIPVGFGKS